MLEGIYVEVTVIFKVLTLNNKGNDDEANHEWWVRWRPIDVLLL